MVASMIAAAALSSPANLAGRSNAMGAKLLAAVSGRSTNMMISPVSFYSAMSLAALGTSGETEAEAIRALGWAGMSRAEVLAALKALMDVAESGDSKAKSQIANSLWLADNFQVNQGYLSDARSALGARAESLNFKRPAATKRVNDWVSKETNGRIPKLFDSIPAEVRSVLVNAIWFRGQWKTPFDKGETKPRSFTLAEGRVIQAPAMSLMETMMYGEDSTAQYVALPYGQGRFSMIVGLPKGQAAPRRALSQAMTKAPALGRALVTLQLPKWTSKFRLDDAIPLLRKAGFNRIFSDRQAQFRRMTPESVFLQKVVHESWIQVDEEGTEAAAATGGLVMPTSVPIQPKEVKFIVDRPFFYVIRDARTSLITFAGVVGNPAQ
jgi:serpin B